MDYYYYRSYLAPKQKDDYKMHITPDGVSLEYRNGRVLSTPLVPRNLFPSQTKLTPRNINDIHRFIKYMGQGFGQLYSKKEFTKIYKRYLNTLSSD